MKPNVRKSEFVPSKKGDPIKADHAQRHPLAKGETFRSAGAEWKWARGKMCSGDFEKKANYYDIVTRNAEKSVEKWRREHAICLEIAADSSHAPEVRTEAQAHADHIAKYKLPGYEASLKHAQESAASNREMAQQARKFEARWSFNPYVDPLLDWIEEQDKKHLARSMRRRKASR
jgi:hypothetical protein